MNKLDFYLKNQSLCHEAYRSRPSGRPKTYRDSVVYMVVVQLDQQYAKIGTSRNLPRRLRQFFVDADMQLIGAISGGYFLESQLHAALDAYRVKGEWFVYNSEVRGVGEMIAEKDFLGLSRWLDKKQQLSAGWGRI